MSGARKKPNHAAITFSGGIVKIPFTELSAEIQKKYGYNSQAANAYSAEQNEQQAALARQRQADEQQKLQERQKYWNEHPASQQAQPQTQPQTSASSMHGSMLDQRPGDASSTHGSTLDQRPSGPTIAIYGKVMQVVDEGLLVTVRETDNIGAERIPNRATVLVIGNFPGVYDDDKVQVVGRLAGSDEYTTVMGSKRTVRALTGASVTKLVEFPANVR
jgi:hypothetical protein